jgi:hypothetical protein
MNDSVAAPQLQDHQNDGGALPLSSRTLHTPSANLSELWNLGIAGYPITQYLCWADEVGLFVAMANQGTITCDEIVACTPLTPRGADAMLGILVSLRFATREGDSYRLGDVCREYLDRRSPYYVGVSLYGMLKLPFPKRLRKGETVRRYSQTTGTLWDRLRNLKKRNRTGSAERLLQQHSRNFPAAVVAARSGHFDGIRHLVDIGGGSGVFAIPLAQDRMDITITLVELPASLPHTREFLRRYNVSNRIRLEGFNVHHRPWPLESCDGVLFGNIMHFCADDECLQMLHESSRLLPVGGRVLIHEMLWNDQRDGPLVTALWNFWLTSISAGRHRTRGEFVGLLESAGFEPPSVTETAGGFSLLVSRKKSL